MTWSLEIHHILVGGAGDATLIVARYPAVPGHAAYTRAVLIDGGKAAGGDRVHQYLNARQPLDINVIAVTHFDEDHYYGVARLIALNNARYNSAIVYDCGRLPRSRERDAGGHASTYETYRQNIAAQANMVHATRKVNSFHIVWYDAHDVPTVPTAANSPNVANYESPTWLLGKDIMWGNGLSPAGVGPGAGVWAENPPGWAPNPPRLRCITANKWVRQAAGGQLFLTEVSPYDGPHRDTDAKIARLESAKNQDNAKSLGFLLEFNQFRYYVAGDLERVQEDGRVMTDIAGQPYYPGVRAFVNQTNDAAGRVLAMKASHHGADTASSRHFLTAMRPSAAIISNGWGNQYGHPSRRTINSLDGYAEQPFGTPIPPNVHPPAPPAPPLPPIAHYLTGFQVYNPPEVTYAGDAGWTAGPGGGTVRLLVTEAQSQVDRRGQVYRGVRAAAARISLVGGLGLAAAHIDDIADTAVMRGAVAACAVAAGGPAVVAATAVAATDRANVWAAEVGDRIDAARAPVDGLITIAINAAPGGAAAAVAAVHAAAPAVRIGVAEAIAATVLNATAANIRAAALAVAVPPVPAAVTTAATAAGHAGAVVRPHLGLAPGAFAAVAAMGAAAPGVGGAGATVAQSAAIGAAIGALAGGANAATLATAVTEASVAAGANAQAAALNGAVVGAAAHGGTPAAVQTAVGAALAAANIVGMAAAAAGGHAAVAATVVDPTMFEVQFTASGRPHVTGVVPTPQNIAHSS